MEIWLALCTVLHLYIICDKIQYIVGSGSLRIQKIILIYDFFFVASILIVTLRNVRVEITSHLIIEILRKLCSPHSLYRKSVFNNIAGSISIFINFYQFPFSKSHDGHGNQNIERHMCVRSTVSRYNFCASKMRPDEQCNCDASTSILLLPFYYYSCVSPKWHENEEMLLRTMLFIST